MQALKSLIEVEDEPFSLKVSLDILLYLIVHFPDLISTYFG